MALQTKTLRLFLAFLSAPKPHSAKTLETKAAVPEETTQDDEQAFLASIAHLSPEDQERKLQLRVQYQRLAARQQLIEVEYKAEQYRAGSWQ